MSRTRFPVPQVTESRLNPAVVVFDFDGTIVDSNAAKARCFQIIFAPFGQKAAAFAVGYHMKNLGETRSLKIRKIGEELGLGLTSADVDNLQQAFASAVVDAVLECPLIRGFSAALNQMTGRFPLYIASATPEDELRTIVSRLGLDGHFSAVIGFPTSKIDALQAIAREQFVPIDRVLLVGDSDNDESAAIKTGALFHRIRGDGAESYSTLVRLIVP